MVHSHYIKCQVCGSITRIRLQIGYLRQHPIVVTCGKCKTSLMGSICIDKDDPQYGFHFQNADSVTTHGVSEGDFFVECSGEFPVKKPGKDDADNLFNISPFINHMMQMGNSFDRVNEYYESLGGLNRIYYKWDEYQRVIDLFENNSPYLEQELKKLFNSNNLRCKLPSDQLMCMHLIPSHFSRYLRQDINIYSLSNDVLHLNPIQTKLLIDFLNTHDGYNLSQLNSKIHEVMSGFIGAYPSLIPAISLQFRNDVDSFDFEHMGTTTSTFETIKQFYIDTYEALGNLMIIPVALNNILYRGDINQSDIIASVDKNSIDLEKFIKLSKANRYSFCTANEKYTDFLKLKYNAHLRNAIGHNDVEFDTITQLITYHPNPQKREKVETEYLLEYELKALHMFEAILAISEYLYQLMRLKFIQDGDLTVLNEIKSEFGPYDLCPCGSGKKYKFCHKAK